MPRQLRDAVPDAAALADLIILYSWSNDGEVIARQSVIMSALGRTGARPDALGARLRAAEDAGWICRRRTHRGTGVTRYRLTVRPTPGTVPFDVVPHRLMGALRDGAIRPGELRTWLFLDQALGYEGRTRDSAAELAARVGVSARTVQRHITTLVDLGVLERSETPTGWMLTRSTNATPTVGETEVEQQVEPAPEAELEAPQAGDTDAGWCDTSAGSMYLTPDSLTPEISPSSRSARHLSERETHATSGRKRPSRGIYEVEGITDVVELLEQDRAWRWGSRRKWLNGILSQAVAPALQSGLSPAAIAYALIETGAGDLDDADELLQPLVPPARAILRALAIDTRLGHACRDCGRAEHVAGGPLRDRLCPWCHEQHHGVQEIPTEVLQRILTDSPLTPTEVQEVPEMTTTATTTHDPITEPDQAQQDRQARDRERRSRYAKRRQLRLIEGTWESTWVPAGPSRVKILQLHDQGWSLAALESMLGESSGHLAELVYEGHHQHRKWVTREREERILDLVPDLQRVPDGCHIPSLGSRRRVQALAVLGWSLQQIADRAGVSKQALAGSIGRERVTARVARVMAGIYAELETSPGPSERVRRHAAAQGWAPPAVWDDIDDPGECPDPSLWTQDQQPGNLRLEDLQDCASWGMTREQAADRLGVQAASVDRWLDRHDAPEVRARFARNEVLAA